MASWLKVLGSAAAPLADDWKDSKHPGFSEEFVASGRRIRRMARGDGIALYAAKWQVVFAWGEVRSAPYETADKTWPWRVDIRLEHSVKTIHEGLPLAQASVAGRPLLLSVRSKSHFELHEPEFKVIRAKL